MGRLIYNMRMPHWLLIVGCLLLAGCQGGALEYDDPGKTDALPGGELSASGEPGTMPEDVPAEEVPGRTSTLGDEPLAVPSEPEAPGETGGAGTDTASVESAETATSEGTPAAGVAPDTSRAAPGETDEAFRRRLAMEKSLDASGGLAARRQEPPAAGTTDASRTREQMAAAGSTVTGDKSYTRPDATSSTVPITGAPATPAESRITSIPAGSESRVTPEATRTDETGAVATREGASASGAATRDATTEAPRTTEVTTERLPDTTTTREPVPSGESAATRETTATEPVAATREADSTTGKVITRDGEPPATGETGTTERIVATEQTGEATVGRAAVTEQPIDTTTERTTTAAPVAADTARTTEPITEPVATTERSGETTALREGTPDAGQTVTTARLTEPVLEQPVATADRPTEPIAAPAPGTTDGRIADASTGTEDTQTPTTDTTRDTTGTTTDSGNAARAGSDVGATSTWDLLTHAGSTTTADPRTATVTAPATHEAGVTHEATIPTAGTTTETHDTGIAGTHDTAAAPDTHTEVATAGHATTATIDTAMRDTTVSGTHVTEGSTIPVASTDTLTHAGTDSDVPVAGAPVATHDTTTPTGTAHPDTTAPVDSSHDSAVAPARTTDTGHALDVATTVHPVTTATTDLHDIGTTTTSHPEPVTQDTHAGETATAEHPTAPVSGTHAATEIMPTTSTHAALQDTNTTGATTTTHPETLSVDTHATDDTAVASTHPETATETTSHAAATTTTETHPESVTTAAPHPTNVTEAPYPAGTTTHGTAGSVVPVTSAPVESGTTHPATTTDTHAADGGIADHPVIAPTDTHAGDTQATGTTGGTAHPDTTTTGTHATDTTADATVPHDTATTTTTAAHPESVTIAEPHPASVSTETPHPAGTTESALPHDATVDASHPVASLDPSVLSTAVTKQAIIPAPQPDAHPESTAVPQPGPTPAPEPAPAPAAPKITITPKNFSTTQPLELPIDSVDKDFIYIKASAGPDYDSELGTSATNPQVIVQSDTPPEVILECKNFQYGPMVAQQEVVQFAGMYALLIKFQYPRNTLLGKQPGIIAAAPQCTLTATAGGETATLPIALRLRGRPPVIYGKKGLLETTMDAKMHTHVTLYIHKLWGDIAQASASKESLVDPVVKVADFNLDVVQDPVYTSCTPALTDKSTITGIAGSFGEYWIVPVYSVEQINPQNNTTHDCIVLVKDKQQNTGTLHLTLHWVIPEPAATEPNGTAAAQDAPPKYWDPPQAIEPVNFALNDILWLVGDVDAGWDAKLTGATNDAGTQPIVRVTGSPNAPMYQLDCVSGGNGAPFAGKFTKLPTPTGSVGDYYRVDLSYDFSTVQYESLPPFYRCTTKAYNGVDPDKYLSMDFKIAPKMLVDDSTCMEEYADVKCDFDSDVDCSEPKKVMVKSCP